MQTLEYRKGYIGEKTNYKIQNDLTLLTEEISIIRCYHYQSSYHLVRFYICCEPPHVAYLNACVSNFFINISPCYLFRFDSHQFLQVQQTHVIHTPHTLINYEATDYRQVKKLRVNCNLKSKFCLLIHTTDRKCCTCCHWHAIGLQRASAVANHP